MTDDIPTLRRQLRQLRELHDGGVLGAAQYDESRVALERKLVDLLLADPAAADIPAETAATLDAVASGPALSPQPARRGPSAQLLGVLALLVVLAAAAGYWFTGSPQQAGLAADSAAAPADAASAGQTHATSAEQIAAMVDKLAARLKEAPDDAEGWAMLARSYAVLGRNGDAVPAYEKAVALRADDATLLADYADALAVKNNRELSGEPLKLVERALKLDPKNLKALSLAGTAAFDRKDYAGAVKLWETLLQAAPPDSNYVTQVRGSIDEARELGKLAPAALPAAAAASAPAPVAAAASAAVSGTVTLAKALAQKASPTDTVFVYARAAQGPKMPLAVLRKQVKDLPIAFRLDDSMAMSPAARLSGAATVVVGARVSKSGQALPEPGDLAGQTAPVAVGSAGLKIEISEVVKP